MEKLNEILRDLEQGKISADHAEDKVLRLFSVSGSVCDKCHNGEQYEGSPLCKECLLEIYDKQTDR